ncbi:glycosyltransferase family 2 protein [Phaeovulum sp. NW3]|uniref:glycosyltransferase family 2 protein n=1 Tax=Phaeovulum sp. NW3 TaxID=2934933 RepID=UPI00202262C7|nr:glycosyltransferase family 2 protein [Phaeovulum sp. NW3]MCL7464702.1 glycosyltransferase [Phaeovulum sp. NW3]
MRVVIAIPTTGRRAVVARTIRDIACQTRRPDLVIVVFAREGDIDPAALTGLPVRLVLQRSDIGLTRQRNRALEIAAQGAGPGDVLLFLDDDFLMARDYLARLEALFRDHSDIVMATGAVLADGIHGPGLDADGARARLDALSPQAGPGDLVAVYNGYGCNMAIRLRDVLARGLRFDPRLPLYGWLEDVDFSRQLAQCGRIVRADALRGIHLGTKTGRSSGLRLGYSQIANPLYLRAKRTMRPRRAFAIMARNLLANLVLSLRPEPEVDRRGRLRGNLRALADLMRGRLRPDRVADFE